jgi:ComF family protein
MKTIERLISLYAPLACINCQTEGAILCVSCRQDLPLPVERCYICNNASRLGRTCRQCRTPQRLVSANAATAYVDPGKSLVWRLKFGRVQAAATTMAQCMAERYGRYIAEDTVIIPVPTATKRVRGRGYDQAQLIARSVAAQTGCRLGQPLRRIGVQEQIGANRLQRRQQLQGALQVRRPQEVRGQRILLIDDVMTTGATLEAAATALYAAGARTVGALVFAQA